MASEIERIIFEPGTYIGDATRFYADELTPGDVRGLSVDWEKRRVVVKPKNPPDRVTFIPFARVKAVLVREREEPSGKR